MHRRTFLRLSAIALGSAALPRLGIPAEASAPHPRRHVAITFDPHLPVHPLLQYGAQAEPDKIVRVVVQKTSLGIDLSLIAALLGLRLLEELHFIKSHVVEVAQKKVLELGRQPGVLYVSPDGPVVRHSTNTDALKTLYPVETNTASVWNAASSESATGNGVTVAVIDTGAARHPDLTNLVQVNVNLATTSANDMHGHGTHIAGVIAGKDAAARYLGIAPGARVVSVKISDDQGATTTSDLLRGMQWVFDHRTTHNIRAVNLSVTAGTAESYRTSPIAAAAERLWLSGIVVVVAAGNRGNAPDATSYAPANDPYVITVGALDDNLTLATSDDRLAEFSSRGKTQDGIAKPDLVAPGRKIVSTLASGSCTLARSFASRVTDGTYLRLSGTSMAAPVVTGVVALLLERFPSLTPNQIKWLLVKSASGYAGMPDGAKMVNALAAMSDARSGQVGAANQGLIPSLGIDLTLSSITWGNSYWDNAYWDNAYWDNAYWDNAYWDALENYD